MSYPCNRYEQIMPSIPLSANCFEDKAIYIINFRFFPVNKGSFNALRSVHTIQFWSNYHFKLSFHTYQLSIIISYLSIQLSFQLSFHTSISLKKKADNQQICQIYLSVISSKIKRTDKLNGTHQPNQAPNMTAIIYI